VTPPAPASAAIAGADTPDDGGESSSDDDYDDLSAFEDMSLVQEQDPSALPAADSSSSATAGATSGGESKSGGVVRVSEPADTVVQCRRYDISITYDKYYQTPRVWLLGYDERGQPLDQEQIFEDIMQDYANKTVTIEKHPLAERGSSSVHASIHPCKHASTMKKIIDRLNDGDTAGGARVDMYLIIFLKFIQSVVPTMNYDFTAEANIG
jgi:ubiquitin-like-conjugating enzyme ATG3